MKTKLLRKIRKRFDYKFEKDEVMHKYRRIIMFDKKTASMYDFCIIRSAVMFCVYIFYGSLFADRDTKTDKRKRLKMFNKINN